MGDFAGRIVNGAIVGLGVVLHGLAEPHLLGIFKVAEKSADSQVWWKTGIHAGTGLLAGMIPVPGMVRGVAAGFVAGAFGKAVLEVYTKVQATTAAKAAPAVTPAVTPAK